MSEDLVDKGSVEGGGTGTSLRASGVRHGMVVQLWVVRRSGTHRIIAGEALLRRLPMVSVGRTNEDENETRKKSRRMSTSPGSRG
jgi:hypothetical protein